MPSDDEKIRAVQNGLLAAEDTVRTTEAVHPG